MRKKILYFDILSGISGDMAIGALLDLCCDMDLDKLNRELKKLNLDGYSIRAAKTQKNGISGTKFDVVLDNAEQQQHNHSHDYLHDHLHDHNHEHAHSHTHEVEIECDNNHLHEHHHRSYGDIIFLIESSDLNENVKKLAKDIFLNIGLAEAKIHDKDLNEVHFHEVGAIDSIVDIVGVAICIDALNVDEILSSSVHVGTGFVKSQHGVIPVPAPATLEILKNVPVYSRGIRSELVTPTGAAIIKTLVKDYCTLPEMAIDKIGYGHGTKDLEITNTLRVILGEKKTEILDNTQNQEDKVVVLETNIDDMSSELYTYLYEKLLANNALDVFSTPILMKKNRPAYKFSVICKSKDKDNIERIIFKETTTFGIRAYEVTRNTLDRNFTKISTSFGEVTVKNGYLDNEIIKSSFEFEDLKKIAIEKNIPISKIVNECTKYIEGEKC